MLGGAGVSGEYSMDKSHNAPLSLQAIQNPNDMLLQERAWNSVCPLVIRLKKFYGFSLRLGTSRNAPGVAPLLFLPSVSVSCPTS